MARLVEREGTPAMFETFHMDGQWDADGTQMVEVIRAATQRATQVKAFPWSLVTAASPFVPLFREMRELRYLWRTPIRTSNRRLVEALGQEPHTPLDSAVRATLAGLGCLPGDAGRAAPAGAAPCGGTA